MGRGHRRVIDRRGGDNAEVWVEHHEGDAGVRRVAGEPCKVQAKILVDLASFLCGAPQEVATVFFDDRRDGLGVGKESMPETFTNDAVGSRWELLQARFAIYDMGVFNSQLITENSTAALLDLTAADLRSPPT